MIVCPPMTLSALHRLTLEKPSRARSYWVGVNHGILLDTLQEEMYRNGWIWEFRTFAVARNGADMVAAYHFTIPGLPAPEGHEWSLGLTTSNALRRRMRLTVGTWVTRGGFGFVSSELVAPKHTVNFDLRAHLREGLTKWATRAGKVAAEVEVLKRAELNPRQIDHIIMQAGRNGAVPWGLLGEVDSFYDHPSLPELANGGAWALFAAAAQVIRKSPPMLQMDRLNLFRELLVTTLAFP